MEQCKQLTRPIKWYLSWSTPKFPVRPYSANIKVLVPNAFLGLPKVHVYFQRDRVLVSERVQTLAGFHGCQQDTNLLCIMHWVLERAHRLFHATRNFLAKPSWSRVRCNIGRRKVLVPYTGKICRRRQSLREVTVKTSSRTVNCKICANIGIAVFRW